MANNSIQQYEPLRIPSNWTAEERKLVQQLSDRLDDIYRRFGRIRTEDLGSKLQTTISEKVNDETYQSYISQTAMEIASKVSNETYQSYITQTAQEIASKVSNANYQTYITQTAQEIASKVSNANYQTYITQTAQEIALKLYKTDPAGSVATDYITIVRDLITILSGGKINIQAGAAFNLRSGSGTSAIGISNDQAGGYIQWAGNADPAAAPFSVKNDGSVKMTKLTLGNSAITDLTQMYAQTFADNADPTHAAVIKLYVPSEAVGVQSLKLSFELEKYRAFSTTTETTTSVEKTSTSGGSTTVTSGSGGILQTQNTALTTGTPSTGSTGGSSTTYTGDSMGDGMHNHSHGHTHTHSHTHDINNHNHTLSDHSHSVTINGHTHKVTIDGHSHAITYGIYESASPASSCTVAVDGNVIGSFSSMNAQDITAYVTKVAGKVTRNAWHTVTITPNAMTRIVAHAFIIMVVGSATNAIY